jgi:hypothetical protein
MLSLLRFFFEAEALFAFSAELPYQTLGPELAISAGVCAGFTVVQAFPAVTDKHLLADNMSIAIRVKPTFHETHSSLQPSLP